MGVIIGNTGAEVLTTMLSWVQGRLAAVALLIFAVCLPPAWGCVCCSIICYLLYALPPCIHLSTHHPPTHPTTWLPCCPLPCLPAGSMTFEEQEAMIASLKSASKSTAFEQWLGAVGGGGGSGGSGGGTGSGSGGGGSPPAAGAAGTAGTPRGSASALAAAAAAGAAASVAPSHQEELAATLAEVAEYLAKQGVAGKAPADPGSIAADSSSFK